MKMAGMFFLRTRAELARVARGGAALLAAASLVGALSGCSWVGLSGEKAKWSEVTLSASDDVNNNSPVAVDIVMVSDEAMLARVAEMPASKWFAGRDDLVSTFPKNLRYRSWEIVPGQRVEISGDQLAGSRFTGAFVFANYQDSGAHRVRIEKFSGHMVVQLGGNNLTVLESK
jgi:type VI secretion system protein